MLSGWEGSRGFLARRASRTLPGSLRDDERAVAERWGVGGGGGGVKPSAGVESQQGKRSDADVIREGTRLASARRLIRRKLNDV